MLRAFSRGRDHPQPSPLRSPIVSLLLKCLPQAYRLDNGRAAS